MDVDAILLILYRLIALAVAVLMVWVLFRERDWRSQICAALVLVPFALRAAGIK
jgi:hypothetical protein